MEQRSDHLRKWTASLAHKLTADETNGKFKFLKEPEFKCVMCKKEFISSLVFTAKDFYLLHQVTSDFGDSLYVASVTDSCKLKTYEINVEIKFTPEINVETKNCYTLFESKTNTFELGGLLLPEHEPGLAKLYTIRFYNN